MNPHGWESFGDFAADALLGLVLFVVLPLLAYALWTWGDK